MPAQDYAIGLMSGTSVDGVDAVLVQFEQGRFQRVICGLHQDYDSALRDNLLALGRAPDPVISLSRLARLDVAVAETFAAVVERLLIESGMPADAVTVIGSHGQTIFHDPQGCRSSLQIGDPNHLVARTGRPVVADFRRLDVALGGQGAPLVPAFHAALFATAQPTTVVNIGGIANVTWLSPSQDVCGFDCGPGNGLMDEWIARHHGRAYDADGDWARQGVVQAPLLQACLQDPYFAQPPPKSTGRGQFNLAWLARVAGGLARYRPEDVQATLCELSACTIAAARLPATGRVLVCGGGAYNRHLMGRLAARMPGVVVESTAAAGLAPEWVEGAAFAWLAMRRWTQQASSLPAVTGARLPAILGGLYCPPPRKESAKPL